jgi:uracil-DNA glycosylase
MNDVRIEQSWKKVLAPEFTKPYFGELSAFIKEEYKKGKVYPPPKHIFNAFDLCPFDKVKVVILGQDPYHGAGQAHGLSFSVQDGVAIPPSLRNIYQELHGDVGMEIPKSGDLAPWAKQGVLLLNATLTVAAKTPMSHHGRGWEEFTQAAISALSTEREHLVFLLWGKNAQERGRDIDFTKHLVLEAPHPSPYSASSGFFGCKHFSQANAYLKKHGIAPIEWRIP